MRAEAVRQAARTFRANGGTVTAPATAGEPVESEVGKLFRLAASDSGETLTVAELRGLVSWIQRKGAEQSRDESHWMQSRADMQTELLARIEKQAAHLDTVTRERDAAVVELARAKGQGWTDPSPVVEELRHKALWMDDSEHRADLRAMIEQYDSQNAFMEAVGDDANASDELCSTWQARCTAAETALVAEQARREFMQRHLVGMGWGLVGPIGVTTEDRRGGVSVCGRFESPYRDVQVGYAYYDDHGNDRSATERAAIDMAIGIVAAIDAATNATTGEAQSGEIPK